MWNLLQKNDYQLALNYLQMNSPFTCPIYGNVASAGFAYKPKAMRSGIYYIYKMQSNNEIGGMIAGFNDGNVMIYISCDDARAHIMSIISSIPCHSVWELDGKPLDVDKLSNSMNMNMDERVLNVMVARDDNVRIQTLPRGMDLVRIDKRLLTPSYYAFIKKCLWEGFGFKSNPWDIRKRIKERTNLEPYWFLSKNNNYVAQAHVQAMTNNHGYIGGVCTPRDCRRKGYAKQIMDMVCNFIYKEGRVPALAVSASNNAACKLYENMGFNTVGTTVVYMRERDFKGDENQ